MMPGICIPPKGWTLPRLSGRLAAVNNTAGLSSITSSGMAIGAADPTRLVLAGIQGRDSATVFSLNSATIGGVTASIIQSVNSTSVLKAALAYAFVPTGTTADVALTFSEAITSQVRVSTFTITGLRPSLLQVVSSVTESGSATSQSRTLAIARRPSVTFGVAFAQDTGQAGGNLTWSGLEELDDGVHGADWRFSHAGRVETELNPTKSISCATAGSAGDWGFLVANFS